METIQLTEENVYKDTDAVVAYTDLRPPIPPRPEAWSGTDYLLVANDTATPQNDKASDPDNEIPNIDQLTDSGPHNLAATPTEAISGTVTNNDDAAMSEPVWATRVAPPRPPAPLSMRRALFNTRTQTQDSVQGFIGIENCSGNGPLQGFNSQFSAPHESAATAAHSSSSTHFNRRIGNIPILSSMGRSFSEIRQKADRLFGGDLQRQQPPAKPSDEQQVDHRAATEPPPLTDVTPVRPTLDQLRDCALPPVVLVHGLFGFGPDEMLTPKGRLHYWETAFDKETNFHGLLVLEASVGPVSSYHDRACELFAQIVGCLVDYGEDHSKKHNHLRHGREFTGKPLYPWWSQERPLHFVGHSAGGNTIRLLQHLLELDYWGRGTNASWIKSVTCIMAPMNGSTAAYLAGCSIETGLFGLSSLVPLLSMIDTLGAVAGFPVAERRRMLMWKLEHFGLQQDDFAEFNRLRQRMSESGFLIGEDNLAYDLTLQSCEVFNALVPDYPNTYYLSYSAICSTSTQVKTFMAAPYLYMLNRNFTGPTVPPGWTKQRDWLLSDGLVPLASQLAPTDAQLPRSVINLSTVDEFGTKSVGKASTAEAWTADLPPPYSAVAHQAAQFQTGIWYTDSIAAAAQSATKHWDHCDVICARGLLWEGIVDRIPVISDGAQALFSLGKRLGSVPKERESFARVSKSEQRRFYEALYARLSQLK